MVNDWDLLVHNRDNQTGMETVNAMHGADCSSPPNRHPVSTFEGSVFICRNHLMTALNGGGYSEIVMTPAQMLDFSTQGNISVDASTLKDDDRDWIDFWISPFAENLLTPSAGVPPDLNGPPRDAVLVQEDASIPSTWRVIVFRNYAQSELTGTGLSTEDCMGGPSGVSAINRSTRAITVSRHHVRVTVGSLGCVVFDSNIPDPGFGVGVVEMAHHSYSPDEGSACNYTGCSKPVPNQPAGNTWHWSNFNLSPAVPFTMLRGDMSLTGISARTTSIVHFAQAAPAASFLRFSALAGRGSIRIFPNGAGPIVAAESPMCGDFPTVSGGCPGVSDGVHMSYFTPIPAGTTWVELRAADSPHANQPWTIQDISIWSPAPGVAVGPVNGPPPVVNPPVVNPPVVNPPVVAPVLNPPSIGGGDGNVPSVDELPGSGGMDDAMSGPPGVSEDVGPGGTGMGDGLVAGDEDMASLALIFFMP